MAVVGGLSHSSISRLKETHSHVSPETVKVPGAGGGAVLCSPVVGSERHCPHLTVGETESWRGCVMPLTEGDPQVGMTPKLVLSPFSHSG